ncbi:MAG: bifunctional adenosylcobinamide kinase/adenosylcobinamide-phosphate guanylyltransferase [Coriobacteriia bacterium]|nr:bifunctional adenosylcobinamide kinase/adenosylcobinamide-phosphate guanylyltransferase [Coriobacteriia bacterium]
MLVVITGPARSGKSRVAAELASSRGGPVVVVAGGRETDPEMARRIASHQAERPTEWRTLEVDDTITWLDDVSRRECVVIECLGTLVARMMEKLVWDDSDHVSEEAETLLGMKAASLVEELRSREGDTIVISNEVGWGIVPETPAGRLFRDVVGRATARLIDSADAAWLVVAGRCIGLTDFPRSITWETVSGDVE